MNAKYQIVKMPKTSKKLPELPGKPIDPSVWSNTLKDHANVVRWGKEKPMGGK
jgi:hypothetical protein